jgi:hypothetical protein
MSLSEEVVDGTLRPDGTLALDREPHLPPGRVRIIIQAAAPVADVTEDWLQYVQRTRRELEVAGHPTMSEQEAQRHIDGLRAGDDRIEAIRRQIDGGRRGPGETGC